MTVFKKSSGRFGGLVCLLAAAAFFTCEKTPEFCSDGQELNPATQFCYNGMPYDKCAGKEWDPGYQTCEDRVIKDKCGNSGYFNPTTEFCNSGTVYQQCDGVAWNPSYQICENRVIKDKCPNSNNYFDQKTEFCADSSVYQKCGGEAYDPANEQCTGGTIMRKCGDGKLAASCHILTASAVPEEGGSVTRNPNATSYAFGESVGVIATPSSNNYTFVGWSGALQSVNPTGAVVMDSDKSLVAMFNPVGDPGANTYTLMTGVDPAGGGTVFVNNTASTGTSNHNREVHVTVRAEAAPGYTFTGWTGTSPSQNAETTLIMLSNHTMIANFKQNTYTLTVNANPAEGGTASREPEKTSYTAGEQVTIKATAKSGYIFSNWTGGTVADANSATTTVSMNSNMTLTANFRQEGSSAGPYTLTVSANPTAGGDVTRSPVRTNYTAGTAVTITATPKTGYEFTGWSGTALTGNPLEFAINSNMAIIANFREAARVGTMVGDTLVYGGQRYRTVIIDGRRWMAENLNYEIHVEGSSKCYRDSISYCERYGRYYDWYAALKVCPSDWRLPSDDDWNDLVEFAGGSDVAGGKLKSKTGWNGSLNGTDDFGFSALPAGEALWGYIGVRTYWWSSLDMYQFYAGSWEIDEERFRRHMGDKLQQYSVRCVRD